MILNVARQVKYMPNSIYFRPMKHSGVFTYLLNWIIVLLNFLYDALTK